MAFSSSTTEKLLSDLESGERLWGPSSESFPDEGCKELERLGGRLGSPERDKQGCETDVRTIRRFRRFYS